VVVVVVVVFLNVGPTAVYRLSTAAVV